MKHNELVLPYESNALEPMMSAETIDYHYGKHYKAYLQNAQKMTEEGAYKDASICEIIAHSDGSLYNNAAQTLNHELFFSQFKPNSQSKPSGILLDAINLSFESFDEMKKLMSQHALALFGSGWVWLVSDDKKLKIVEGSNAYCPLVENMEPLLAIDVWEHAYYIDYRNKRADYVTIFWSLVDWSVIEQRYIKCVTCEL